MPKQFGWLVFFNTKKKLVSTGFEPTTSRSTAKRLIHLSYENIWIFSSINLLFICAITRAFPSEPPNVNPDSGTPPRVFYTSKRSPSPRMRCPVRDRHVAGFALIQLGACTKFFIFRKKKTSFSKKTSTTPNGDKLLKRSLSESLQ